MEQGAKAVIPCRRSTMPSKSRCRYCYKRERRKDPTGKSKEIKRRCANPTNGCVVCNAYVCGRCWPIHLEEVQQSLSNEGGRKRQFGVMNSNPIRSGSVVMESLFNTNGTSWNEFLETQWRNESRLFTYKADIEFLLNQSSNLSSTGDTSPTLDEASKSQKYLIPAMFGGDGYWRKANMNVFPLREIIRQGWHILVTLMNTGKVANGTAADHNGNYCHRNMIKVTILQDSRPKTQDEILRRYNGNLYDAYISGCSISWENCDMISPHIAALCQDLQGEQDRKVETERGGAFRCVHSTAHLSPPQYSEICSPKKNEHHTLIFQLVGRKFWKTTSNMPAGDASSFQRQAVEIETTSTSSTQSEEGENQSSYEGYLYPGDVLYITKGMYFQTRSQKNQEDGFEPSISFHVAVTLHEPDAMTAKKSKDVDIDCDPTVPDTHSSSNRAICTVVPEPQQAPRRGSDRDYNIALSKNRSSLIEQAERTSPNGTNLGKRKGKPKGSKAEMVSSSGSPLNVNPLDSVIGPIAASNVSYQTEVRVSTTLEKKHCQDLLLSSNSSRSNEKIGTGLRRELHGIANLISARYQMFAPGGERASSTISSARVADVCDLVKKSVEDRSEYFLVCDLTLLALVRREVEAGTLAIVNP